MSKRSTPKEMVSKRNKSMISCSTPEPHEDSPSRDSDSTICDSDCASPVPFLCTQDGAEGETDVVWNFYTPKSGNTSNSRDKNSTPLSRRPKKSSRPKTIEKHIPKRRPVRPSQKKSQLFRELYELNQNLHELMAKKQTAPERLESGSEEDIFKTQDCSPKCIPRSSSRCLRKNVLSSNFGKPDPDPALESDDSMNEYLLKASQIVEEEMVNISVPLKRFKYENRRPYFRTDPNIKLDTDSMDVLINISTKLDSPILNRVKCESLSINNDSFDNFVGNLNDSALEQLTQMPIKADLSNITLKTKDWTVKELVVHDSSPMSKSFLSRHNSMPASPSLQDMNKPSTSGMAFGRFSSMPFHNDEISSAPGDSPIRCTPDEIKKKHQLAREKLMAKRLPFTSQQTQSLPSQLTQMPVQKKTLFQPKIATSINLRYNSSTENLKNNIVPVNDIDLKQPQFQPKTASSISEMDVSVIKANVPISQFQPKTLTSAISKNNVPVHNVNVSKSQFQPKNASATISKNNALVHNANVSKVQFQPKTHSSTINLKNNIAANNGPKENGNSTSIDLKQLIEKKRQEALMKLRRRQPQNK